MKKAILMGCVGVFCMSTALYSVASDYPGSDEDYLPFIIKIDRSGKPHLFDEFGNKIDSPLIKLDVSSLVESSNERCVESADCAKSSFYDEEKHPSNSKSANLRVSTFNVTQGSCIITAYNVGNSGLAIGKAYPDFICKYFGIK